MLLNVLDFGAVGDGICDDAEKIQSAIDECSRTGGTVLFPSGYTFLSSSLIAAKNVELRFEKNSVLKATGDINGYFRPCDKLNDPKTAPVGNPVSKPAFAFIYGYNADNFSISGEGTIDGNCYSFVERQNEYYVTGNFYPRPTMIYIENSRDLKFSGVTLTNAPFWTLHPAGCENVLIDGIKILNPLDVANSDGIDPDHCDKVEIKDCILRCADDCICLKNTSGNSEYGDCTNIHVHDCELTSTSAAIKIGTEGVSDFRNVTFERCNITASNRGISIQVRDGGNVENVLFKDIKIDTRRFHSSWWGTAEPIIVTSFRRDENTVSGKIKNITFENISCESENGAVINCDNNEIEDITFKNVNISVKKRSKWEIGLYDFRPCIDHGIEKCDNNALRLRNCTGIVISDCNFSIESQDGYGEPYFSENVNKAVTENATFSSTGK